MNSTREQLIVIDLGSQYTQIIARELLRLGYRSVILRPEAVAPFLKEHSVRGIILSGGAASVYDVDAPNIPEEIFTAGCPILGICFGMQFLAYRADASLVTGGEKSAKEYGPTEVHISPSVLFEGLASTLKVWASHGDIVRQVPAGYREIARSEHAIQAMEDIVNKMYAVQFHPEVIETEDDNKILYNFVHTICACEKDWEPKDRIAEIQKAVIEELGAGRAAIGVSGGVDSTTIAAMLAPILKDKLFAFFIDTGAMRMGEVEAVAAMCKDAGIDLHIIDAKKEFFESVGQSIDAEEKRQLFKNAYQPVFKKVITENNITHIMQGTLATDLIESGHLGDAKTIKSHHNVGLDFGVTELTPFSKLFKYEVREIARSLGLAAVLSERKPFPGPGLFVRVVGVPVTPEIVEKVRTADHLVNEILKNEPIYNEISQVVVALLGSKTVGVQGDSRSYNYPIVVRTVASTDFMTVKGVELPSEIRKKIITAVTKHGFNRVFFDETPKPPATTELE